MFHQLRAKAFRSKDAIQETFFSTKEVFEKHKVVFTIGTSVLSAGAAWAGYVGRKVHQDHLENRLKSIEESMKNHTPLEPEKDHQLLTWKESGVSYKACFATAGTASVITYILGWRSGRNFTLNRIEKQKEKLLLAATRGTTPSPKRELAARIQQRLISLRSTPAWRSSLTSRIQQRLISLRNTPAWRSSLTSRIQQRLASLRRRKAEAQKQQQGEHSQHQQEQQQDLSPAT